MDTTKKLLKNIPEHLLYFGASNLICLLVTFAVNFMLRSLLMEFARGDAQKELLVEKALFALFSLLFYVVLGVILAKSSIQRTAYLAATIDREYSFGADLAAFCKSGLWIGLTAYALFCLPITVILALIPDINYLPTLFYPQYAAIELMGPLFGYLVMLAGYGIFSLLLFPCLHRIWEKSRLYTPGSVD